MTSRFPWVKLGRLSEEEETEKWNAFVKAVAENPTPGWGIPSGLVADWPEFWVGDDMFGHEPEPESGEPVDWMAYQERFWERIREFEATDFYRERTIRHPFGFWTTYTDSPQCSIMHMYPNSNLRRRVRRLTRARQRRQW